MVRESFLCIRMLLLVTLCGCGLTGRVRSATMEQIGNLVNGPLWNQTKIDLSDNKLSGPIPPELGSLTNLTYLSLHNNDLSGPIPPELGDLTNLYYLDLYTNNLSGPIPPQLGNLVDLLYLNLHDNDLSGPIPPQLGYLTKLRYLYLSNNNLSGPIPLELGNLTDFNLFLYNNNLSGPIPPALLDQNFFPGNSGLCCANCSFGSRCTVFPPPATLPPQPSRLQPPPPPLPSPPVGPPPSLPPVLSPQNSPSIAPLTSGAPPLSPPPTSLPQAPPPSSRASSVGPIAGGALGGAALLLALATLGFCLYRRRKRMANRGPRAGLEAGGKDEPQDAVAPARPASKPRREHFPFKQLQKATGNFGGVSVIGRGSFGTVYKGVLADGSVVAIKRLETRPGRKDVEERSWKAEVEALGKVRHKNLVPLLGVCAERGERLLIFEYFARGSLDRRLHHLKDGEAALTWADRMRIARSICKGLTYLHNDIRPSMVHRDVKAANILLSDDDLATACIADFGLAHLVQDIGGKTSTMVKGTVPYMAPEYLHGGARFLTPKCDVYSFGMLSLELISGRPVVRQLESGVVERLLKVATDLIREGRMLELVDPAVGNAYDADEARKYIHVALACLRTDPSARPTMEGVGSQLALASVVDSSFREEDVWESEGSSAYLGSLSSSSGARSIHQSTVQVASRFLTPR